MNTAKHLQKLSWLQRRNRRSPFWIEHFFTFIPAIVFACLLGTYIDLYFVGKDFYAFPIRPFSDIYTINIAFTLGGIPIIVIAFLYGAIMLSDRQRWIFIFLISFILSFLEGISENLGYFTTTEKWRQVYSFVGYFIFLKLVWAFYQLTK